MKKWNVLTAMFAGLLVCAGMASCGSDDDDVDIYTGTGSGNGSGNGGTQQLPSLAPASVVDGVRMAKVGTKNGNMELLYDDRGRLLEVKGSDYDWKRTSLNPLCYTDSKSSERLTDIELNKDGYITSMRKIASDREYECYFSYDGEGHLLSYDSRSDGVKNVWGEYMYGRYSSNFKLTWESGKLMQMDGLIWQEATSDGAKNYFNYSYKFAYASNAKTNSYGWFFFPPSYDYFAYAGMLGKGTSLLPTKEREKLIVSWYNASYIEFESIYDLTWNVASSGIVNSYTMKSEKSGETSTTSFTSCITK